MRPILALCLFALPLPTGVLSAQCAAIQSNPVDIGQPVPVINPVAPGDKFIGGKVMKAGAPAGVGGIVQICVNAVAAGTPQPVAADGSFVAAPVSAPMATDIVTAQFKSAVGGNPSLVQSYTVPTAKVSCARAVTPGSPSTINFTIDGSGDYSGTVPNQTKGIVVICVNDVPTAGSVTVGSTGAFSGSGLSLSAGQTIIAVYSPSAAAGPYTYTSTAVPITAGPLQVGLLQSFSSVSPLGMAVVGLDISGASSTDPKAVFLATGIMDIPVMGASAHDPAGTTDYAYNNIWWLSGLLRIAGMAQPGPLTGSLGDLASTGTYLSSAVNANPDQVVQSIEADASVALQWKSFIAKNGTFGVGTLAPGEQAVTLFTFSPIISMGALTPLSASQSNPPVYYLTQQIMSTYNISPNGCGYMSGAPPCYVSFVPSDRTHFYRYYSAGFRLKIYGGDYTNHQYRFPGNADVTVGQNEYVTGGRLHGAVLHIGGSLPVPTVDGVYIFGSMDLGLNFKYNQENPQLLLTPVPSSANVTYVSPTVNQISVSQPNRDRYRLGFGIDIFHVISALKAKAVKPTGS